MYLLEELDLLALYTRCKSHQIRTWGESVSPNTPWNQFCWRIWSALLCTL